MSPLKLACFIRLLLLSCILDESIFLGVQMPGRGPVSLLNELALQLVSVVYSTREKTAFSLLFEYHCREVPLFLLCGIVEAILKWHFFKKMLIRKGQMAYYWTWSWKTYIWILALLLTSKVASASSFAKWGIIITSQIFSEPQLKIFKLKPFQYLKVLCKYRALLVFCTRDIYFKVK